MSDLAIPPGEYLAEVIRELGREQTELAQRLACPALEMSQILAGLKAITPEMALQLESCTDVPATVWMTLERQYRLVLAAEGQ